MTLFDQTRQLAEPVVKPAELPYLRSSYQGEIEKIRQYYQGRSFMLNNDHILMRILRMGLGSLSSSVEEYSAAAEVRSPAISRALKLTSEISRGVVHSDQFYSEASWEILLASEESFDPFEVYKNWKDFQSVRAVYHPLSDLSLGIPNGKPTPKKSGFSVVSINIAALLLQYRAFIDERRASFVAGTSDDAIYSADKFLSRYILPNMLYTQTDIACVNRWSNMIIGKPNTDERKRHPFMVIDYTQKLDRMLVDLINAQSNTKKSYTVMLKSIPVITAQNGLAALKIPDMAPSRQVWWALLTSRITVWRALSYLGGSVGEQANRQYVNEYLLDWTIVAGSHVLQSAVPAAFRDEIIEIVEETLPTATRSM